MRWLIRNTDDQRSECTTVRVPLDHADPGGRQIDIAVSRLRATGDRTGAILVNPGGPGQQGVTMPRSLARSKAAGLNVHHDLVGFDPRGIGYSTAVPCQRDTTEPDPSLSPKERARFTAERDARRNRECFDRDPGLVRSMTTENVARDMDVAGQNDDGRIAPRRFDRRFPVLAALIGVAIVVAALVLF